MLVTSPFRACLHCRCHISEKWSMLDRFSEALYRQVRGNMTVLTFKGCSITCGCKVIYLNELHLLAVLSVICNLWYNFCHSHEAKHQASKCPYWKMSHLFMDCDNSNSKFFSLSVPISMVSMKKERVSIQSGHRLATIKKQWWKL